MQVQKADAQTGLMARTAAYRVLQALCHSASGAEAIKAVFADHGGNPVRALPDGMADVFCCRHSLHAALIGRMLAFTEWAIAHCAGVKSLVPAGDDEGRFR